MLFSIPADPILCLLGCICENILSCDVQLAGLKQRKDVEKTGPNDRRAVASTST